MRIGDYDIEINCARISGGFQAIGKMPDGREVISAPKSSQQAAEQDVAQQIRSRLYPQRRYDVNRPFESMNIDERKAKLGSGARFAKLERSLSHKKGVYDPAGLAAAMGRKSLGKKRFQKLAAAGRRRHSESLSEMDQAIVMHQADRLLEAVSKGTEADRMARSLGAYQIKAHPFGGKNYKDARWYAAGGQEYHRDLARAKEFVTWLKERHYPEDTGHVGPVPFYYPCGPGNAEDVGVRYLDLEDESTLPAPKAEFYPSDGGSAGGGGGITST